MFQTIRKRISKFSFEAQIVQILISGDQIVPSSTPFNQPFKHWGWILEHYAISPYRHTTKSFIKIKRKKEMITNLRSFWLLNEFSFLATKEMYRKSRENMNTDVRV